MDGKPLPERVASLETALKERAEDIKEIKSDVKEIKGIVLKFNKNCLTHRAEFNRRLDSVEANKGVTQSKWQAYGQMGAAVIAAIAAIVAAAFAAGWMPF